MMRIDIISAVPSLLESPFNNSILKRAQEKKLVKIKTHNLRDYSSNKQKSIDDYAFGGGAGMVLSIEPVFNCIQKLQKKTKYDEIIYMTPDGEQLNQSYTNQLSLKKNLIIICGHYKGIDQRIRDHLITKEISIGDYVLSGGELPAAVLCDGIIRLLPGVLNNETSALTDSFQDNLLAPPVYTRPADFNGWKVPEILTSGNLKAIEDWRDKKAIEITKNKRPDLSDKKNHKNYKKPFNHIKIILCNIAILKTRPMDRIKEISNELNEIKQWPSFSSGDTITVTYKIKEGNKERLQSFQGTVLQRRSSGTTETFTIRKMSGGTGVERIFPLASPFLEKIVVNKEGAVRRSKLFYLRERTGKSARIKEKKTFSKK